MLYMDKMEEATAPDTELISTLRDGETGSVDAFVRRNISWMVQVADQILKDHAAAEDCVQAAFVRIFQNLDTFRGESSLRAWMRRIVINEALGALRKTQRLRESPIDELMPRFDTYGCRVDDRWRNLETPESLLVSTQTSEMVLEAIDLLPDMYRVVLLLRDIEEFTTAEAAAMLGVTESNLKVRLHRARAAIKKLLEPLVAGENQT